VLFMELREKIERLTWRICWVPLLLGIAGYWLLGGETLWNALYASAALYFVNPVSDISNVFVILAKYTALFVTASIIFQALETFADWIRIGLIAGKPDAAAICTDLPEGRELVERFHHAFLVTDDPSDDRENRAAGFLAERRMLRAAYRFVIFSDDMKSLKFCARLSELEEEERKKTGRKAEKDAGKTSGKGAGKTAGHDAKRPETYLLLRDTDSILLSANRNPRFHFYNVYELVARDYWRGKRAAVGIPADRSASVGVPADGQKKQRNPKDFSLYDLVMEKRTVKVAIVGCGPAGRALFRFGYIGNIFRTDQSIEYHIFGAPRADWAFLRELTGKNRDDTLNQDQVVVHEEAADSAPEVLCGMDRVIFTEENFLPLLQMVLERGTQAEIHCFTPEETRLETFFNGNQVRTFGLVSDVLTEKKIRQEELYTEGKLLNYDYEVKASANAEKQAAAEAGKQTGPQTGADSLLTGRRLVYEEEAGRAGTTLLTEQEWSEVDRLWSKLNGFDRGSNLSRADRLWVERRLLKETPPASGEEIARMEHLRWCRYLRMNRFRCGKVRNKAVKQHNLLVPFDELPDSEKYKDGSVLKAIGRELDRMEEQL